MMPALSRRLFASCIAAFAAVAALADADPPSIVAALTYFNGTVTYAPAGSDDWAYATLNRPFTTGDRLWTDQGGRAELHVGTTAVRLDSQTSLDLADVEDQQLALHISQGSMGVRVQQLYSGQAVEIDTPQFALVIRSPGHYRVDVSPGDDTTRVSMGDGDAVLTDVSGNQMELQGPQNLLFGTDGEREIDADPGLVYDGFEQWVEARDHYDDNSQTVRYVSREVIGYENLDSYGSWEQDATYGPVWIPQTVVVGWAPYRDGHWTWIAPWGWTWVDNAPWGFAPFHYGRWVFGPHGWCWVPGPRYSHPIYAPALVVFASGGHDGPRLGHPNVTWFPLGPNEPYMPGYRTSTTYQVNLNHNIGLRTIPLTGYVNQQKGNAITSVTAETFMGGRVSPRDHVTLSADKLAGASAASTVQIAPGAHSVFGASPAARNPVAVPRAVVSLHPQVTPPALQDSLAKHYVQSGGAVAGVRPWQPVATQAPVRQLPPVNRAVPVQAHTTPSYAPAQTTERTVNTGSYVQRPVVVPRQNEPVVSAPVQQPVVIPRPVEQPRQIVEPRQPVQVLPQQQAQRQEPPHVTVIEAPHPVAVPEPRQAAPQMTAPAPRQERNEPRNQREDDKDRNKHN